MGLVISHLHLPPHRVGQAQRSWGTGKGSVNCLASEGSETQEGPLLSLSVLRSPALSPPDSLPELHPVLWSHSLYILPVLQKNTLVWILLQISPVSGESKHALSADYMLGKDFYATLRGGDNDPMNRWGNWGSAKCSDLLPGRTANKMPTRSRNSSFCSHYTRLPWLENRNQLSVNLGGFPKSQVQSPTSEIWLWPHCTSHCKTWI